MRRNTGIRDNREQSEDHRVFLPTLCFHNLQRRAVKNAFPSDEERERKREGEKEDSAIF